MVRRAPPYEWQPYANKGRGRHLPPSRTAKGAEADAVGGLARGFTKGTRGGHAVLAVGRVRADDKLLSGWPRRVHARLGTSRGTRLRRLPPERLKA